MGDCVEVTGSGYVVIERCIGCSLRNEDAQRLMPAKPLFANENSAGIEYRMCMTLIRKQR